MRRYSLGCNVEVKKGMVVVVVVHRWWWWANFRKVLVCFSNFRTAHCTFIQIEWALLRSALPRVQLSYNLLKAAAGWSLLNVEHTGQLLRLLLRVAPATRPPAKLVRT